MKIVVILLLSALTNSAANHPGSLKPESKTSAGCSRKTVDGDCCYFPFSYFGITYNDCTTAGWYREWCSLTANYHSDLQWGHCAERSCGSKPTGTRIVGGAQAQKDSWPWQVSLAVAGGSQFCGGSLIQEQWVLTAAHCVKAIQDAGLQMVVRLGAYKITDIGREIEVEKSIMHEKYFDSVAYANDIALLKLKTPAILNEGVGLVCLPNLELALEPGKRCYVTGWGTLSSGGNQPIYLQEASVPIVSDEQCKASYGSSRIHESMICAGFDEGGVDACQGDSGGPMVCEFGGTWYLEGATSWGTGCARPDYYGVYAKVRHFKTWVEDTINSN